MGAPHMGIAQDGARRFEDGAQLEPHEFVRPLQRRKDARCWRGRSEADGGAGRQQGSVGAHVAGACMPHLFARGP